MTQMMHRTLAVVAVAVPLFLQGCGLLPGGDCSTQWKVTSDLQGLTHSWSVCHIDEDTMLPLDNAEECCGTHDAGLDGFARLQECRGEEFIKEESVAMRVEWERP